MPQFFPSQSIETLLRDRYYQPGEDWLSLCHRIANFAASREEEGSVRDEWADRFFSDLSSARLLPNSPAIANSGTDHKGCIAACFNLRPEDSMASIMETRRLAVMILKYGGGVGFEFSALRPQNFPVQSTHKQACGPIGVLKDYNAAGELVTQGGMRKAALMGILRIDHPDIVKFITCKEEDKALANFNVSVSIPDTFMKKLAKEPEKAHTCHFGGRQYNILPDGEWILRADRASKKVMSVQDVWDLICSKASENGDPGVYFVDHANRANPLIENISDTESPFYFWGTNPCSELPLPVNGACVLASLDLAKFVDEETKELDEESLWSCFETSVRMLDNLIDVSSWPDPVIEEVVKQTRQVGVGIMGLTSLFDIMKIRYGSKESVELIEKIGQIRLAACQAMSKKLAEERGIYPAAREGIECRNSTTTTQAPTGTLAMIANTSWGIEPHLYWAFQETRNNTKQFRVLPAVEKFIPEDELADLQVRADGDLKTLNGLIQEALPSHMVTARDLTPNDHLDIMAAWQRYTESSISKTIVKPLDELQPNVVSDIYTRAWQEKLKGITVYPEGSREGEPMSLESKKKTKLVKLPDELDAKTIKVKFDVGGETKKAFIHVGFHPDNKEKPVQVFLTHPYEQDETFVQFISLMTRLVSLCLRYRQCPHCGEEALPIGQIVKQLNETDGQSMFSAPKILVEVLGKYLDAKEAVGVCPNCSSNLYLDGRCSKCVVCGWSLCS